MTIAEIFTLGVLTHNRPVHVRRQFNFLAAHNVSFRVVLLDSSDPEIQAENAAVLAASGLNVEHRTYPPMAGFDKIVDFVRDLDTPYMAINGEDDILLPLAIPMCLDLLEREPDYVAAHGEYVNFSETLDDQGRVSEMTFSHLEYHLPSLDGGTAMERMLQLLSAYEAVYYTVVRTKAYREAAELCLAYRPAEYSALFNEFIHGIALLVQGKIKRFRLPFLCRNTDTGTIMAKRWQTMHWFVENAAELGRYYADYRAHMADYIVKTVPDEVAGINLLQALDMVHTIYFCRQFNQDLTMRKLGELMGLPADRWTATMVDCTERQRIKAPWVDERVTATAENNGFHRKYIVSKVIYDHMGASRLANLFAMTAPWGNRP